MFSTTEVDQSSEIPPESKKQFTSLGKISIILMQNAVSEKVEIKHRDLEKLLEELHDTAGQINYTLDKLRKGKTGLSEKKREKLCKE